MKTLIKPTLCIYHANCADGFGAALAVWLRFADSRPEFVPAAYGETPPNCTGHDVLLVDFSYKLPVLEQIIAQAKSVTILDHHKTAEADIQPLLDAGRVHGEFDMARSGAAMAWDWCFPDDDRPRLIEYIQDRDLWQFNLEGTREISAALFSYDQDFEVWKNILAALEDEEGMEFMVRMGQTLRRKHNKDLDDILKATKRRMLICGYSVPVANVPYIFASDAGNIMAEGELFSASYFDTPDGRKFSLRSKEDGMDVSEIAKRFGGGGHARAAGFMMPIGWDGGDE
ncbi:MAG: oligoribonuclease NrnB/cAMP/cGMP phosphodiesterase (DHH superfamily) [Marinobacter maritimus]|jgi:oligoribonuclease NrnB/cAMP/cGMP phosphodiesterase (DHH superfamily)